MCDFFDQHHQLYERSFLVTAIRQYILSVICAGFLCGIVQMLFSKSSIETLIKLITGLIITMTVIAPLLQGRDFSLGIYLDQIALDGDHVIAEGERAAAEAVSERIKERTETYVLGKAAELGAVVTVDIELESSTPPVPVKITISGNVSPYVKRQLSTCLQKELGIPEDSQIWIS